MNGIIKKTRHPEISFFFMDMQNRVCSALEAADGSASFKEETWQRQEGGGGKTRVIQNGAVIEKGGVNFSEVYGPLPEFMKSESPASDPGSENFYATGLSIVIHPHSPRIPIIHMNVRYFETGAKQFWFGGGIDLTPIYIDEKDARFFHAELKKVCDRHHADYYPEFKKWADEYFFIPHRDETRGIGGIFFDHLKPNAEIGEEQRWNFVKTLAESFIPVYTELISRNKNKSFGEAEKKWQRLRRGRYAEFNLVYDRGTKFGLNTGGRTESILMSLPPQADWDYHHVPEPGTPEAITLSLLKKGIDWIR